MGLLIRRAKRWDKTNLTIQVQFMYVQSSTYMTCVFIISEYVYFFQKKCRYLFVSIMKNKTIKYPKKGEKIENNTRRHCVSNFSSLEPSHFEKVRGNLCRRLIYDKPAESTVPGLKKAFTKSCENIPDIPS